MRSLYYVTDPVSAVIKLRSNLINACILLPLLLSAQHCSCRFNGWETIGSSGESCGWMPTYPNSIAWIGISNFFTSHLAASYISHTIKQQKALSKWHDPLSTYNPHLGPISPDITFHFSPVLDSLSFPSLTSWMPLLVTGVFTACQFWLTHNVHAVVVVIVVAFL